MPYTKEQLVTGLSILYLLITTGLAGYAKSRAQTTSLPVSTTLTTFTTALPVVAGLLLRGSYAVTRHQERRKQLKRGDIQRPPIVIVINTLIFIYSTVVITLLGTHAAPPSGLDCGLHDRWQSLFHKKNENAIKTIQDALTCCGFKNSRDMAFPFPSKTHGVDACEKAFSRHNGCLEPWKAEEQSVAGILIGVVGMVFVWQLAIIVIPTQSKSWLHQIAPERISRMLASDNPDQSPSTRRTIEYPQQNGYSDRIQEESNNDDLEASSERAIEEGNRRLDNALPGHLSQEEQSSDTNAWARE